MLKINGAANGEVVLTLSGRRDAENLIELKSLFKLEVEGRRIVLDLEDLTLVKQKAVRFLGRCEADSIRAIAYSKQQRNTFGCRFREIK